jgi:hypothetical protein
LVSAQGILRRFDKTNLIEEEEEVADYSIPAPGRHKVRLSARNGNNGLDGKRVKVTE